MLENGYIKLYRTLLKWEWYSDTNTKVLFLHLLLTVNYEDVKWRGKIIKRGQRVLSIKKLSKEIRLTERQTRTALQHLITTNEVSKSTTARYTLITVNNYDKYQTATNETTNYRQATDTQSGKQVDEQATNYRQATDNKERKNNKDKNIRSINNPPIIPPNEGEAEEEPKPNIYKQRFEEFWKAYPKKKSKGTAEKAFYKIKPTQELQTQILKAIKTAEQSEQWQKENGQFIPYPASWLNSKGWEDEYEEVQSGTESSFDTDEFFEAAIKRSERI